MKAAVVTVSYNSQENIERTIKSVLSQDFSDFEYWIQDGGSSDGTLEIIEKYKERFEKKNIKYNFVSERDEGIFDAMNKSIKRIQAEFVIFLNCGDFFTSSHVLANVFEKNDLEDIDIIYGNYYRYGKEYRRKIISEEPYKIMQRMICSHQAIFTRTALLCERNYNTEYKMAADYDFYLEMYLAGKHYKYMDMEFVYFEVSGISQKNARQTQKERLSIQLKHKCITEAQYKKQRLRIPVVCLKKWILGILPDFFRYRNYESFERT